MQQWPAQVDPVHALIEQGAELSARMEKVGDGADQMCSFLQQAPETSRGVVAFRRVEAYRSSGSSGAAN
jgi:hypothetical protein